MEEVLSPLADTKDYGGSMIDYNVRAERMGWLPSRAAAADQSAAGGARCAGRRHGAEGLRGQGAQGRLAEDELRGPRPSGQLAAQHVRLALQPARLARARATSTSSSTCSAPATACRARTWAASEAKPAEVVWHDKAPEGKLDLLVTLDFRMSTTCLYFGHRAAHRHLVREERPQHQRHAPVHPPAVDRGGPGLAIAQRLGDLQGLREEVQRSLRRPPGRREGAGADAADARHARRSWRSRSRCKDWKRGECELDPRQDRAEHARWSSATTRTSTSASPRSGPLMAQGRQRRQGHRLEHADRGEAAGRTQRPGHRRRRDPRHAEDRDRHRRLRGGADARARDQRPCRGEGLGGAVASRPAATTRTWRMPPRGREDPLPRHPGAAAQDHQLARPGAASRARPSRYNAGYTNVHELIPWRTLTGRQQFYHGPPVDDRLRRGLLRATARRWT